MRVVLALLLAGLAPSLTWAIPHPAQITDEERRDKIESLLFEGEALSENPTRAQQRQQYEIEAERAKEAQEEIKALLARAPNDADLHWLAGMALMKIGEAGGAQNTAREIVDQAIAEFDKARHLAPDGPHAYGTAESLGILYSKLGQHDRALVEYDRAIQLRTAEGSAVEGDPGLANHYGNSAEALMALGRLDESIARYRRAAELSVNAPRSRALAFFGLGVALDRDEQLEKSREAIRQAMVSKSIDVLDDEDVFFMPDGDKSYYKALACLASNNSDGATRELREFLARLPNSRYAGRARAHLAEIAAPAKKPASVAVAARPFDLSTTVLHAAFDGAARREIADSRERLRACFADARLPARFVGHYVIDLRDDPSQPFLTVQIDQDVERLPPSRINCLTGIARGWRGLLRDAKRATVMVTVEAK